MSWVRKMCSSYDWTVVGYLGNITGPSAASEGSEVSTMDSALCLWTNLYNYSVVYSYGQCFICLQSILNISISLSINFSCSDTSRYSFSIKHVQVNCKDLLSVFAGVVDVLVYKFTCLSIHSQICI